MLISKVSTAKDNVSVITWRIFCTGDRCFKAKDRCFKAKDRCFKAKDRCFKAAWGGCRGGNKLLRGARSGGQTAEGRNSRAPPHRQHHLRQAAQRDGRWRRTLPGLPRLPVRAPPPSLRPSSPCTLPLMIFPYRSFLHISSRGNIYPSSSCETCDMPLAKLFSAKGGLVNFLG